MYSISKVGIKKTNISIFLFQTGLLLRFFFIVLEEKFIIVDLIFYFLFFIAFIVVNKFNKKNIIIICFLFVWSMVFPSSDKRTLFFIFVMCYFLLDRVDVKQYCVITILQFVFLCLVILFSVVSGLNRNVYYTDFDRTRSLNLGFKNPNTGSLYFYGFFLCLIILVTKTFKKKHYLFLLLLNFFLNFLISHLTNSRGAVACSLAIIVFFIFLKPLCKSKILIFCMKIMPLFLLVIQIFLCRYLKQYTVLDIFLTGRLSLYNDLISKSTPIDYIFGNANIITQNKITVDNAYFRLLYSGGIPCFILFQVLYARAVDFYVINRRYFELSIILGFIVYGIIESVFTNVIVFTIIVFWVLIFYPQKFYISENKIPNFFGRKYLRLTPCVR